MSSTPYSIQAFESAIQSAQPVLVDFYADWCEPCKWLDPILEELTQRVAGKAEILKVNTEAHPVIAENYHIRSVPTLIIFKNGVELWRMQGFKLVDELEATLASYY